MTRPGFPALGGSLHSGPSVACALSIAVLTCRAALVLAAATDPRARALGAAEIAHRDFLAAHGADDRRAALTRLERSAASLPMESEPRVWLGEAYLDCGFGHEGRYQFERAVALDSSETRAWIGIARAWKHDWIMTMDRSSLGRAESVLTLAVRAVPASCGCWSELAMLRYEEGDVQGAGDAAARSLALDPHDRHAQLAAAFTAYRSGRPARADSLFADVVPRLPPEDAAHFADLLPLLSKGADRDYAELAPRQRGEFSRRFWTANDPDPTSPSNSARLEYYSRVAFTTLLMDDPPGSHWDARAEVYVRYGVPRVDAPALAEAGAIPRQTRLTVPWRPTTGTSVIWYPEFGIVARLTDITQSGHFQFPYSWDTDTDPQPDTNRVARAGLLMTGGGRALFPPLPPLVQPHALVALVSRFEGEHGGRLLAQVKALGGPADSLTAECVVLDSTEHEVARRSGLLAPSRCGAAEVRTGEFAIDLPPGPYRVAFAVKDRAGRRGVARMLALLPDSSEMLGMSDLVPVCSLPDAGSRNEAVRLDAELPAHYVGDDPLLAYFEVYRLRADGNGTTRFDYEYSVRPLDRDPRPWFQRVLSPGAQASRVLARSTQEGTGPLRRQYITVPLRTLAAGRYRLTVEVRDRSTGATVRQSLEFEKSTDGS